MSNFQLKFESNIIPTHLNFSHGLIVAPLIITKKSPKYFFCFQATEACFYLYVMLGHVLKHIH